jgi:hypothetical protein
MDIFKRLLNFRLFSPPKYYTKCKECGCRIILAFKGNYLDLSDTFYLTCYYNHCNKYKRVDIDINE